MTTCTQDEEKDYKIRIQNAEIDELRHALKYAELQFAKAKEDSTSYHAKLVEAERTVDDKDEEIKKLVNSNSKQKKQIRELEIKNEDEIEIHKDKSQKQEYRIIVGQNEINANRTEIKGLKSDVSTRDAANHKSIVKHDLHRRKIANLETIIAERDDAIADLRNKLQGFSNTVDSLHCARRTEGAGMVEVEHLKLDNQRLLTLLKSTKEFKDFSGIADASNGRIHYADESAASKENPVAPKNWMPTEALEIANRFRVRNEGLSEPAMNRLLAELNKVWWAREQKRVNTIQKSCNTETKDLRRKLASQVTKTERDQSQKIARMEEDLKKAHMQLRNLAGSSASKDRQPAGFGQIESAFKSALNSVGGKSPSKAPAPHGSFSEGAVWLGEKVISEGGKLETAMKKLKLELESRQSVAKNHDDVVRNETWFCGQTQGLVSKYLGGVQEVVNGSRVKRG